MTTDTAMTTTEDREAEGRRKLAILKAVGLDRVSEEQRELSLAIARRYDLDLMLKHLVLIDGKPYVTRDALLWIAHRSGQFDGIAVTKPTVGEDGKFWESEATVWRKDMTHPFVYSGRYPTSGGNQKFAPEMCVKVAESMALRRAFNISAPTQDERWDVEVPTHEPEEPKTLATIAAERAAQVAPQATETTISDTQPSNVTVDPTTGEINDIGALPEPLFTEAEDLGDVVPDVEAPREPTFTEAMVKAGASKPSKSKKVDKPELMDAAAAEVRCEARSPFDADPLMAAQCRLYAGHKGVHRSSQTESWDQVE